MLLKIINLNCFFYKKDCITYILFFTFAAMKRDQKQRNYSTNQSVNNSSFLRVLKRLNLVIGRFNFDTFQYLKVENEKLQIIYANIRV